MAESRWQQEETEMKEKNSFEKIPAIALEYRERAIEHRRALHRIPEVGLELPKTVSYIKNTLSALGIAFRDCGGGIVADMGSSGPLVAIRADMDALAIEEETGLDYESRHPGAMHACGHDAHSACLLVIAEILARNPPAGHRVRLLFQPGEEGYFGAKYMIEDGALEGVAAIVGGHVGKLSDELEDGQAGFMAGPMMAASDIFKGSFIGSGGHGSAPHQALDPIPALAQFIMGAQNLRARKPDQRRPFVISVCRIDAGTAHNIIPGVAHFEGTVRTLERDDQSIARTGLIDVCRGIADSCGLEYSFEYFDGYPALVNHVEATRICQEAATQVLGQGNVKTMTVPSMGGEDFAYFLEKIPGCFWFMNTNNQERGITHPNHHPLFNLDEDYLDRAIALNLAGCIALAGNLEKL